MGFLKSALGLGGLLLGGPKALVGGLIGRQVLKAVGVGDKKKRPIVPAVSEFAPADGLDAADQLRRRRGAANDMITGRGGEPSASVIGRLILGS